MDRFHVPCDVIQFRRGKIAVVAWAEVGEQSLVAEVAHQMLASPAESNSVHIESAHVASK